MHLSCTQSLCLLTSAPVFHFQGCLPALTSPLSALTGPAGPQGPGEAIHFTARPGAPRLGGWRRGRAGRRRGAAAARGGVYVRGQNQKSRSLRQQAPILGPRDLCHMIFVITSLMPAEDDKRVYWSFSSCVFMSSSHCATLLLLWQAASGKLARGTTPP